MTSLTAIFGSSEQENAGDSEKLLELYWNRAELKKEFASLREQTFQLKEQIKTQEGRTARVHQKYEHLENLLLDPDWVHNVAIFYQLRSINQRCKDSLAEFAEKLKQQREQRQHSRLLDEWNEKRRSKAEVIEASIEETRMRVSSMLAEAMGLTPEHRHFEFRRLVREHRMELNTRWRRNIVLNKWLDYLIEQGHLILER